MQNCATKVINARFRSSYYNINERDFLYYCEKNNYFCHYLHFVHNYSRDKL